MDKEISTVISQCIDDLFGLHADAEAPIAALGLDPGQRVHLAAEIEARLNLPAGIIQLERFERVGDVINFVAELRNA